MKIPTLRRSFFAGLLLLAPVGVTVFVFKLIIDKIGAPISRVFLEPLLPPEMQTYFWLNTTVLSVLSLILAAAIITLLGIFSQLLIGRFFVQVIERAFSAVPGIRTVYNTVKQIVDTFSQQQKAVFQECVLIEFPHKGKWVMGFYTGGGKGEIQRRTDKELMNVFVPTTPNPTSGFLVMVPKEDVVVLDMSISDGMKVIISGGAVTPPDRKAPPRDPDDLDPGPVIYTDDVELAAASESTESKN